MSRIIKFRAFRKYPKAEMIYFTLMDLVFNRFNLQVLINYPQFPKMQYIGLEDKNGKEIYEGDIVEGFGGEKYKVIWEDNWSRFVFENFDEEDYSYDPADNENCSQHYLEVIGNIYENSDLLSDDKKGENK